MYIHAHLNRWILNNQKTKKKKKKTRTVYKKLKRKNSSDNQTKPISLCAVCMSHNLFFEPKKKKTEKKKIFKNMLSKGEAEMKSIVWC